MKKNFYVSKWTTSLILGFMLVTLLVACNRETLVTEQFEDGDGIRDSVVTWNDDTHQGYQNTSGLGVLLDIR